VSFAWPEWASAQSRGGDSANAAPARGPLALEDLDSWLTITEDGKVTFYTGRVDMGTGTETAYAQVLADELEVPYESVTIVMGDTGLTPDQSKSTGSSNISRGLPPIRAAAAEARLVLLTLASERLVAPIDRLQVRDGIVIVAGDPG